MQDRRMSVRDACNHLERVHALCEMRASGADAPFMLIWSSFQGKKFFPNWASATVAASLSAVHGGGWSDIKSSYIKSSLVKKQSTRRLSKSEPVTSRQDRSNHVSARHVERHVNSCQFRWSAGSAKGSLYIYLHRVSSTH